MLCPPVSTTPTTTTTQAAQTANGKLILNEPAYNLNNNNNTNSCSNLNGKQPAQHDHSAAQTTTIREIKSRNLSCQQPQPAAAPSMTTSTTIHINISNSGNTSHLPVINNRQAISMEQLNNIQQSAAKLALDHNRHSNSKLISKRLDNGGGSLSSGGSSSSLDDSSDERRLPVLSGPRVAAGLTRSASRVSRFKSAKEFFERLSTISNQQSSPISSSTSTTTLNRLSHHYDKPPIPDRPRGNVVFRYTGAVAAKASSHANLSNIHVQSSPASTHNNAAIFTSATASPRSPRQLSYSQLPAATPQPAALARPLQRPSSASSISDSRGSSPSVPVSMPVAVTTSPTTTSATTTSAQASESAPSSQTPAPVIALTRSSLISNIIKDLEQQSQASSLSSSSGSGSLLICDSPPQSPKSLLQDEPTCLFLGDNVIVNNGSLLIRRNKQLRLKFDENCVSTFEYPSEEVMLAEPESPPGSPAPQQQQHKPTCNTKPQTNLDANKLLGDGLNQIRKSKWTTFLNSPVIA